MNFNVTALKMKQHCEILTPNVQLKKLIEERNREDNVKVSWHSVSHSNAASRAGFDLRSPLLSKQPTGHRLMATSKNSYGTFCSNFSSTMADPDKEKDWQIGSPHVLTKLRNGTGATWHKQTGFPSKGCFSCTPSDKNGFISRNALVGIMTPSSAQNIPGNGKTIRSTKFKDRLAALSPINTDLPMDVDQNHSLLMDRDGQCLKGTVKSSGDHPPPSKNCEPMLTGTPRPLENNTRAKWHPAPGINGVQYYSENQFDQNIQSDGVVKTPIRSLHSGGCKSNPPPAEMKTCLIHHETPHAEG